MSTPSRSSCRLWPSCRSWLSERPLRSVRLLMRSCHRCRAPTVPCCSARALRSTHRWLMIFPFSFLSSRPRLVRRQSRTCRVAGPLIGRRLTGSQGKEGVLHQCSRGEQSSSATPRPAPPTNEGARCPSVGSRAPGVERLGLGLRLQVRARLCGLWSRCRRARGPLRGRAGGDGGGVGGTAAPSCRDRFGRRGSSGGRGGRRSERGVPRSRAIGSVCRVR